MQIHTGIGRASLERGAAFVIANQSDKGCAATERHNVGGRISCATKHTPRAAHFEYGDWGFRGNSAAIAEKILIENGVTENKDAPVLEVRLLTAKSLSVSILADYLSSVDGEPYYRMSQYRRLSSSKVNHSFWSIRRIFADVVRAQTECR
jgi:hypothetical protein